MGFNAAFKGLINCDIKLVSYSSTITMMHGPMYIRFRKVFGPCNE